MDHERNGEDRPAATDKAEDETDKRSGAGAKKKLQDVDHQGSEGSARGCFKISAVRSR
jgi:hypothetical protein